MNTLLRQHLLNFPRPRCDALPLCSRALAPRVVRSIPTHCRSDRQGRKQKGIAGDDNDAARTPLQETHAACEPRARRDVGGTGAPPPATQESPPSDALPLRSSQLPAEASSGGSSGAGDGGAGSSSASNGITSEGTPPSLDSLQPQSSHHMPQPQSLPGSVYFLHTTNDSLPRVSFPSEERRDCGSGRDTAARAQRLANLASSLVQFVAKLPPPSPGSAAEALRSRLGRRLGVAALGEWVAQAADAINSCSWEQRSESDRGRRSGGGDEGWQDCQQGSGAQPSAPLGAPLVDEAGVEAMLAAQPQLLAQDSQVLADRLRGLAQLLHLAPAEAVRLAASRPGLLLLDSATLERRLEGLAAAFKLPDRAAAAVMARNQPAWLYADLPTLPHAG